MKKKTLLLCILSLSIPFLISCTEPVGSSIPGGDDTQAIKLIDHTSTDLTKIPDAAIRAAKANLHIAYNHTSHGSQLITGMNCLEVYPDYSGKYSWNN
ncbi:MAG: hypothetical protein JEY91_15650, partial [Spirochaetaceae bacterium]|nr:hypothetical protein [Spirochaetaceae bacterium]